MIKFTNVFYITLLCLGAFSASFLIPILHKSGPSDFKRTNTLLSYLNEVNNHFDGAILGSSIFMAGINANILKENMGKEFIHFGSTGQSLAESLLYYPLIKKKKPQYVIQGITIYQLMSEPELDKKVLENFILFGYENSKELESLISKKYLTSLNEDNWKINKNARNVLVNQINTAARIVLRPDLDMKKSQVDLYYPNAYTKRLSQDKYKRLINLHNPEDTRSIDFNLSTVENIFKAKEFFEKDDTKYILTIAPINPDLTNYTDEFYADLDRKLSVFRNNNIAVLNLSNALAADDFVDHFHPSAIGARVLSQLLVYEMR